MTARNIALLNATYSSVPAVQLPISGGGTATFTEITDTTATASDVATGKYFYTSDGTKTQGTNSGGGGGNDFIITASRDEQGVIAIDKTFAEVFSAYRAGKNISVASNDYWAVSFYIDDDPLEPYFDITTFYLDENYSMYTDVRDYNFASDSPLLVDEYTLYRTFDATAIPSDVISGKIFYTNTGRAVGTSSGGSSKNVQVMQSTTRVNASSLTKACGDLTVSKTGTYDIYWSGGRSNTSTSYTWGTRLYVDGSGYGTENTSWTNNCQSNHLSNVSLTANQKLSVYARGRTGSYYTFVPMLTIIEV